MLQVSEVMTRGVRSLAPSDTIQLTAQAMEELTVGTLPVCEGDEMLGIVTDRDITVRAVAQGLAGDSTPVSDVMSQPVETCHEDDELDEVTQQMEQHQIMRMVVLDDDGQLVGILTLGDIAAKANTDDADNTLAEISTPSEPDR